VLGNFVELFTKAILKNTVIFLFEQGIYRNIRFFNEKLGLSLYMPAY
jgi:hypothetical protein